MKYRNLDLIGTSHIAEQSLNEVKQAIENDKPDIVALELDRKRFYALMHGNNQKPRLWDMRKIGVRGFVFSLIGAWAEKKLGEQVGISPGSEMKKAAELAKKHNLRIALIDQDIEITLKNLSNALTWKEKWNFIADIFKAVVMRKKEVDFDLRTVPGKKLIKKLIEKVKERYPNLYRVLVEERNHIMAKKLMQMMKEHEGKRILAIVGAGHEEEIIGLIKKGINKVDISYSYSVKA